MKKVITYGTYDLLHYGHIRLLERAKALGDYLIVGVTADDFDKTRGKINVKQSLMERVEAVRETGLADEIIVEEYEGQKIDDIQRYGVDIFTVGSDWKGKFDYLKEYCDVVYLDRTQGISSTELRSKTQAIRLGICGDVPMMKKFFEESKYVNGIHVTEVYVKDEILREYFLNQNINVASSYEELLQNVDAVYIVSYPTNHFIHIKQAIEGKIHVLCESPLACSYDQFKKLHQLAEENEIILMDSIKTAYSTAYSRLLLLLKSGKIGRVMSVDATCTSLMDTRNVDMTRAWNSLCSWGPTAMLPVFQILGTDFKSNNIISWIEDETSNFDLFSKIDFIYENAVGSIRIGKGVKSEGELIISGTEGYVYVPAPWWKTDYFEIRYEDQRKNKRYFYQLDGEGIRCELVAFMRSIELRRTNSYIDQKISETISRIIEQFNKKEYIRIN